MPLGFFEGRIRCVRFCAEINAGPVTRNGVHEIWPVETADEGIVGHAALHERNEMPRVLTAPGIHVHWREVVRLRVDAGARFRTLSITRVYARRSALLHKSLALRD